MLPVLFLLLVFFTGFAVGYATRALRSHMRQQRYRLYAPYSRPQENSLTRARRAF